MRARLAENQRQFRELDSTVSAALAALDGEIAAVMHQALSLYMQVRRAARPVPLRWLANPACYRLLCRRGPR